MTDTAFYQGLVAVLGVLRNIWESIFSISFFGSGFTFGDLFLGIVILHMGLYFLDFFANNGNRHVDDSGTGVKY